MSIVARLRQLLARSPWLYWAIVAVLAGSAGLLVMRAAGGVERPTDLFDLWGVCWLIMPLACVFLGLQSVTKLRPRLGAVLKSTTYALGAAGAAALFVAYPLVA